MKSMENLWGLFYMLMFDNPIFFSFWNARGVLARISQILSPYNRIPQTFSVP